ncbi:nucleotidyl transferase AbiEii/AbiGii toxin family protein [Gilvimarinus sp. SDUM040013]|uniref:Nucleotidyl transferase AbiEii/AbiGii toxin family protein n=1 Tax=Gilvimarinus gilvus TaxID=3058038 RepID=A0ABU4RWC2_9GAMM|nr:nucleotidyl transferase AbiEii/AbiGii toxin family protein [Gilvimarinus sp. SDUM040013]MDO3386603.1 nucleotidyl transferase AbiEii/AbiGii toxin family protein [Gilvimarinus sp. SDUM040013]MDX6849179.1 nucleotidyl transferase AbiEii/AbiGii toxin family protein [Gilvimarinus sp. SDUM040013]
MGLLLDVLPEVAKEACFAMHGGTAINLFVRNMPRLSVDIDLTYVEIAERNETLEGINSALLRIKERIEALRPSIWVQHKENVCKLQLDERGVLIKIEVNMVGRGLLGEPNKVPLCEAAQEQFDAFCTMPLVPLAQLYGGKLCAALDRQHPRDLFDVKLFFENEGLDNKAFTDEIKQGFILGLVSSNRPTHEMLVPNLQDQRAAFESQFQGMSEIEFSYDDYEATRLQLIDAGRGSLNEEDKTFLLSLNRLKPDWSIYDYQKFPSVKWKLLNLEKFKKSNPEAYAQQLNELEKILKS